MVWLGQKDGGDSILQVLIFCLDEWQLFLAFGDRLKVGDNFVLRGFHFRQITNINMNVTLKHT